MDTDAPIEIKDEGVTDRYFHIMLNMADDELDPYEYRLLGHYRRVCGAKNVPCTESTRTTAERCKMSAGKVSETRQALAAGGWIWISEEGNRVIVTLVDRMPENVARYSGGNRSPHERSQDERSPHEQSGHHMNISFTTRTKRSPHERHRSHGERKKKHIKKEPIKEPAKTSSTGDRGDQVSGETVDDEGFIRHQARAIGLGEEWRDKLLALGVERAAGLLITAQRRAQTNPAGLLITMLRGRQPPTADDLALAPLALELRTVEPARLDRELRGRRFRQAAAHTQNGSEPPAASNRSAADVWQAVLGQLRVQLNRATFDTWLKGTTAEMLTDGVLTVRVRHAYGADWCRQHVQPLADRIASTAAGAAIRVVFEAPAWMAPAGS